MGDYLSSHSVVDDDDNENNEIQNLLVVNDDDDDEEDNDHYNRLSYIKYFRRFNIIKTLDELGLGNNTVDDDAYGKNNLHRALYYYNKLPKSIQQTLDDRHGNPKTFLLDYDDDDDDDDNYYHDEDV